MYAAAAAVAVQPSRRRRRRRGTQKKLRKELCMAVALLNCLVAWKGDTKKREIYTRRWPRDNKTRITSRREGKYSANADYFFLLFKCTRLGAIAFVEKLIENQRKLMIAYKHDRNVYIQLCNIIYKFERCLWQTVLARSSIEDETTRLSPTTSSCKGAMTDSSYLQRKKK